VGAVVTGGWLDTFPRARLYPEPLLAATDATSAGPALADGARPAAPRAAEPSPESASPPRHLYAEMASLVASASVNLLSEEDRASLDLRAEPGPTTDPPATGTPPDRAAAPAPTSVVDVRDPVRTDPRSTPALVRALLGRTHEVYGVTEAGELVVTDALTRTGATSAALLLPDGDTWRVAAGEGLRRLEHRFVLTADSWLVTTIASRHKGVIIDRTDVARRPLAGAPLAAHKHLVAAPVRSVAGILLIARDEDPGFGENDLLSLAQLAEASSTVLASALDARQLARLLGDIRDQDDRAASDRIDYGV
jgi:hypothetical protein